MPVGAIVLWYGPNIPEGWQECSGQMIDENEMSELKNAISTSDYLPDLNRFFKHCRFELKIHYKSKKLIICFQFVQEPPPRLDFQESFLKPRSRILLF